MTEGTDGEECWEEVFDLTIQSILEERESNPDFAQELNQLDEMTDYKYDLLECLEAYFDHMEETEQGEVVIASCDKLFDLFQWKEMRASEFKFRKGNALEALKRYDEAEAITAKYLGPDLICDKETDTFFMAAYRLFEMTDNKDAKRRVEKKMPITIASLGRHCKRKI